MNQVIFIRKLILLSAPSVFIVNKFFTIHDLNIDIPGFPLLINIHVLEHPDLIYPGFEFNPHRHITFIRILKYNNAKVCYHRYIWR